MPGERSGSGAGSLGAGDRPAPGSHVNKYSFCVFGGLPRRRQRVRVPGKRDLLLQRAARLPEHQVFLLKKCNSFRAIQARVRSQPQDAELAAASSSRASGPRQGGRRSPFSATVSLDSQEKLHAIWGVFRSPETHSKSGVFYKTHSVGMSPPVLPSLTRKAPPFFRGFHVPAKPAVRHGARVRGALWWFLPRGL